MVWHFCTLTGISPVMLNVLLKSLHKEIQGGCVCSNFETLIIIVFSVQLCV